MTKTLYEAAALTAAVAPKLAPAYVRESEQFLEAGDNDGLQTVVITDSAGKEYDTTIAETKEARTLLARRAKAAILLRKAKEAASLGFHIENVRHFNSGKDSKAIRGLSIMVTRHYDGDATELTDLTEAQCGAIGTAIGAIHRMNPQFLIASKMPSFDASVIEKQLKGWMRTLSRNPQVPREILNFWQESMSNPTMFDFQCRPVHGGFDSGDVLFQQNDVNAVIHWEDLQVNDPARDLAWMYKYLDADRRDATIAAYARIMGQHVDSMIMLRARLWVQMEQVRDFIAALERADNVAILELKAQLDQLAHQINLEYRDDASHHYEHPNTVTVGDLLRDDAGGTRTAAPSQSSQSGMQHTQNAFGSKPTEDNIPAGTYTVNAAQFAQREGLSRGKTEQLQHFSMPRLDTEGLNLRRLSGDAPSSGDGTNGFDRLALGASVSPKDRAGDDSAAPASAETVMYPAPHFEGADEFSDGFTMSIPNDARGQINGVSINAGVLHERTQTDQPEQTEDATGAMPTGSDTQTVMLPMQPKYFEEDSVDDPAYYVKPHFTRPTVPDADARENNEDYTDVLHTQDNIVADDADSQGIPKQG